MKTIEDYLKEFDDKFVPDDGLLDKYHGDQTTAEAIKEFITQMLQEIVLSQSKAKEKDLKEEDYASYLQTR